MKITEQDLAFLQDYFQMAKYAMWFSDVGERKAYEIANEIKSGKHGSKDGVQVQMGNLLKKIHAGFRLVEKDEK